MAEPHVTICIPAYRQPDLLPRALASVAEHSFRDHEENMTNDFLGTAAEEGCNAFQGTVEPPLSPKPEAWFTREDVRTRWWELSAHPQSHINRPRTHRASPARELPRHITLPRIFSVLRVWSRLRKKVYRR
jgi:hypothetical protein